MAVGGRAVGNYIYTYSEGENMLFQCSSVSFVERNLTSRQFPIITFETDYWLPLVAFHQQYSICQPYGRASQ